MLGYSLLKLIKIGLVFSFFEFVLLLFGMATAFVVSLFSVRFLMRYIKRHDFRAFGWYRIILGLLVLIWFALKKG